jgi:hypothetical protein
MQEQLLRWAAACGVALGLTFSSAQAQDESKHLVSPTGSGNGLTLSAFAKRIDDSAKDYQAKYPGQVIDRIINFDVAFGKDAAEFQRLNGYAVMLVSAISHDPSELPMAKVYFEASGKSAELPVVARVRRAMPQNSAGYTEFGPYREDIFVLVPALAAVMPVNFSADFATHRTGFVFGKGPVVVPDYLVSDKSPMTNDIKPPPPAEAIEVLIRREYAGFLGK